MVDMTGGAGDEEEAGEVVGSEREKAELEVQ